MDSFERWRGTSRGIDFEPGDFDILDTAISLSPELRLATLAAKWVRAGGLRYPIEHIEELERVIPQGRFAACGHVIDAKAIRRYLPQAYLPIVHEGELISRVYTALMRCEHEAALAARAAPVPAAIID